MTSSQILGEASGNHQNVVKNATRYWPYIAVFFYSFNSVGEEMRPNKKKLEKAAAKQEFKNKNTLERERMAVEKAKETKVAEVESSSNRKTETTSTSS